MEWWKIYENTRDIRYKVENYKHKREYNAWSRSNIWSNIKTKFPKLINDSMPQIQETLEKLYLEQTQRNDTLQ